MSIQSCCFTGHRRLNGAEWEIAEFKLNTLLSELVAQGCKKFYAGGALGFDTLAELCVLKLKKNDPSIKLYLFLPCTTQSDGWSQAEKNRYDSILKLCDGYSFISTDYKREYIFERNRLLIDSSDICICYQKHEKGGTAYTVNYAKKKGKPIINIAGDSVS